MSFFWTRVEGCIRLNDWAADSLVFRRAQSLGAAELILWDDTALVVGLFRKLPCSSGKTRRSSLHESGCGLFFSVVV